MTTLTQEDVEELRALFDSVGEDQSTITKRLRNVGRGLLDLASQSLSREEVIRRLRAALQQIVDDADSDDGATSWDGGDVARAALAQQPDKEPGLSAEEKWIIIGALRASTSVTNEALRTAIHHIEHMAAWIGKLNAGYSFESLGEDMSSIRAAVASETVEPPPPTPSPATPSRADDWQGKVDTAMDLYELAASPSPPAQSVEGEDVSLIDRLRKQAVCVYLAAEEGPAKDLSDGLTKAADHIATLTKELAEARKVIELNVRVTSVGICGTRSRLSILIEINKMNHDWLERNKPTGEAG